MDLWHHKVAFLVTFNLEKLVIYARTFLGLTPETTICDNCKSLS